MGSNPTATATQNDGGVRTGYTRWTPPFYVRGLSAQTRVSVSSSRRPSSPWTNVSECRSVVLVPSGRT